MTVKEFKEWVNEIPEEYDDMDLEITTYSDDGPESFYRYDLGCGLGFGVYDIEIYREENWE